MGNLLGGPGRPAGTVGGLRGTAAFDPQKLNHRHEAVMNWMLMNPGKPLKAAAAFFGYTPHYLYMLTGSDMFKAAFRMRSDMLGIAVVQDVRAKLEGVASACLDATMNALVEGKASETFLTNTTKTLLDSLGYSSKARGAENRPGGVTVTTTVVNKEALDEAREASRRRFQVIETKVEEAA